MIDDEHVLDTFNEHYNILRVLLVLSIQYNTIKFIWIFVTLYNRHKTNQLWNTFYATIHITLGTCTLLIFMQNVHYA